MIDENYFVHDDDGSVVIEGDGGDNIIDCSTSLIRHEIYGYGGSDTLIGGKFVDSDGSGDFIAGGSGNDCIYGGEGGDAIDGGGNDDEIYGDGGNDIIFGGVGSAPASGVGCELHAPFIALGSSYLTKGGSGDDTIYGGDGDDCIDAGSGEDFVYGEDGNDTLEGGNHSDWLEGGQGNDWIDGGWHSDICIGGDGNDTFKNCELDDGSDPVCEDGTCDSLGEDSCSCSEDCGLPPGIENSCSDAVDNDCDGATDCDDLDCTGNSSCSCNNDGICDYDIGEDCNNCSSDCAGKSNGKPSGRYCCGDGIDQSAELNDPTLCGD